MYAVRKGPTSFLACGRPAVSALRVEDPRFPRRGLGVPVGNQWTITVRACFRTVGPIPAIWMRVLCSCPPSRLRYCNESRIVKHESHLCQDCFKCSGSVALPYAFSDQFVRFCPEAGCDCGGDRVESGSVESIAISALVQSSLCKVHLGLLSFFQKYCHVFRV